MNKLLFPFRFKGKDFLTNFCFKTMFAETIFESSPLARGDADRQRGKETIHIYVE